MEKHIKCVEYNGQRVNERRRVKGRVLFASRHSSSLYSFAEELVQYKQLYGRCRKGRKASRESKRDESFIKRKGPIQNFQKPNRAERSLTIAAGHREVQSDGLRASFKCSHQSFNYQSRMAKNFVFTGFSKFSRRISILSKHLLPGLSSPQMIRYDLPLDRRNGKPAA